MISRLTGRVGLAVARQINPRSLRFAFITEACEADIPLEGPSRTPPSTPTPRRLPPPARAVRGPHIRHNAIVPQLSRDVRPNIQVQFSPTDVQSSEDRPSARRVGLWRK